MARQQRQDPFQNRLQELRTTGLPEKVYISGKSDFDGIACDVFQTLAPSLEELVAPANPTIANSGHGGVFKWIGGGTYETDPDPLFEYAKTILKETEIQGVKTKDLASPTNVEVHLLQDPNTRYVHAFFMPSQSYFNRIRNEMQDGSEGIS